MLVAVGVVVHRLAVGLFLFVVGLFMLCVLLCCLLWVGVWLFACYIASVAAVVFDDGSDFVLVLALLICLRYLQLRFLLVTCPSCQSHAIRCKCRKITRSKNLFVFGYR